MYKYWFQKIKENIAKILVKRWLLLIKNRFKPFYFLMYYSNINQKFILLEIANKFFLNKIKKFNLKLQLKFKLNFNLKIIAIHCLILKLFSASKNITFKKSKLDVYCCFKLNFTRYVIQFLTKLNLIEGFLFTKNNFVLNNNLIIFSFKNFITFSKLENLYYLLATDKKINLNFFITNFLKKNLLIYFFRKTIVSI